MFQNLLQCLRKQKVNRRFVWDICRSVLGAFMTNYSGWKIHRLRKWHILYIFLAYPLSFSPEYQSSGILFKTLSFWDRWVPTHDPALQQPLPLIHHLWCGLVAPIVKTMCAAKVA